MKKEVKQALAVIAKAAEALPNGDRAIVVLDRGWVFVGSLTYDETTGLYTLTDAQNVRSWSIGGFGMLSLSAKQAKATLDSAAPIVFHANALLFRVAVDEDWDG